MKLITKKGTQLRPIANGESLTVKTKGREVKVDSSLSSGIYDEPLNKLFREDINPNFNQ